jgi:hypothetical protein
VAPSARTLAVAPDPIDRYFRVIRRCLDESDVEGQRCFSREIERYGRHPLFNRNGRYE